MEPSRLNWGRILTKLINIKFNDKPVATSAHTARRTVLYRASADLGTTHADPIRAAELVLYKWREQVRALGEAGCPWFTSYADRMVFSNCCPSMVINSAAENLPVCKYPHICPWCFGRRVEWLGECCGLDDREVFERRSLDRLYFTAKQVYSRARTADEVADLDMLRALMKYQADGVRLFTRGLRKLTDAVYWRISPYPTLSEGARSPIWEVAARLLVVLKKDRTVPCRVEGWEYSSEVIKTADDASRMVQAVGVYPTTYLTGDAESVGRALLARGRLRLSEFSGFFRGSAKATRGRRVKE